MLRHNQAGTNFYQIGRFQAFRKDGVWLVMELRKGASGFCWEILCGFECETPSFACRLAVSEARRLARKAVRDA